MTEWVARRFWTAANVAREVDGWTVRLDERAIRTPSKRALIVPTEAMAEAIAAEWNDQREVVDPGAMPVTRAANTAIDKVAPNQAEIVAMLVAYGGTDLLCYRAPDPDALTLRQRREWDPLLEWAHEALGARLVPVVGVMPRRQDDSALARLSEKVGSMGPFVLTGFHDLVTLSGSLVLGLAVVHGRLAAAEAWKTSRVDEEYQAETWGRDEEADRASAIRRDAFLQADYFVSLSRSVALHP